MATQRPPKRVIIAIDNSENARYAFDFYLNHLHKEGDTVYLTQNLSLVYQPESSRDEIRAAKLWAREEGRHAMKQYVHALTQRKISVWQEANFADSPGEFICDAARKYKADLIVMGSRGLNKLRRVFLGSVSDHVVHNTPHGCAVVVCRRPDDADTAAE